MAGVRAALQAGAHPQKDNSLALRQAADDGHFEIVKFLQPISNAYENDSEALRTAAFHGHRAIGELLPISDPKANESGALRAAATRRHGDLVKLLLPFSEIEKVKQMVEQHRGERAHKERAHNLLGRRDAGD